MFVFLVYSNLERIVVEVVQRGMDAVCVEIVSSVRVADETYSLSLCPKKFTDSERVGTGYRRYLNSWKIYLGRNG